MNNYRQICSILLEHGARTDAIDMQGCTPLHYVKSKTLVKLLIAHKANALVKNKKGQTPRMYYEANTPIDLQDSLLIKKLQMLEDEIIKLRFTEEIGIIQSNNASKNGSLSVLAGSLGK
jgi:ankyrin repeat protein